MSESAAHPAAARIQVTVNGQSVSLTGELTVTGLVNRLQLAGKRIAVERNQCLVPRSQWPATPLCNGDRLEIVRAVGGG